MAFSNEAPNTTGHRLESGSSNDPGPARSSGRHLDSEERYRSLIDSMDVAFCLIQMLFDEGGIPYDYRFLETNAAFEKHTGLVSVVGKTVREAVPDHDVVWFKVYGDVALTGKPARYESTVVPLNRWFEVYAQRVGRAEDRRVGVFFNDTTARKLAETAAQQSEQRLREQGEYLRRLLESSPDCIMTLDLTGRIVSMTAGGQAMMEVDDFSRICELNWRTIWEDEATQEAVTGAIAAANEGRTGRFQGFCPTFKGTPKWWDVIVSPILGPDGKPEQVLGISRDITEKTLVEERERNRLNELFQKTPAFMALVRGEDHVYEMANPRYMESVGHREILGKTVAEAFPEFVDQGFVELLDRVYETGEALTAKDVRVLLPGKPGEPLHEIFLDPTYQPLRDETGRVYAILSHGVDVTERVHLEEEREQLLRESHARAEREALLSDASRVLNASLEYTETLVTIARLMVPRFADWCAVDILDDAGKPQRVAVEHMDPEKAAWGWELDRRYPTRMEDDRGIARVLRTGEPSFAPQITDEMLTAAIPDEERLRLMLEIGFTSVMIVPLAVRKNVFGAISLIATRESGRTFSEDDLRFASEIGQRAALAVENARLFRAVQLAEVKQRRIADALQESMLLATPDENEFAGLSVDSYYEAAWDDALIGGDYGDIFRLRDNRVAILVGDCTGKGLAAARFVAECEFMARAFLREDPDDPARALTRLNTMLIEGQQLDSRPENALTTLVVAVISCTTGEVILSAGGAEPPLCIRASTGLGQEISLMGPLLGMNPRASYENVRITLAPGDVVVLTTDGVTEARNAKTREFFGYNRLLSATEDLTRGAESLKGVAHEIILRAKQFAGGKLSDDTCVVAARFTGI